MRPPDQILAEIRRLADIIDPPPLPEPICRDPDDDIVLALAAKGDLIVSGDNDLLALGQHAAIHILNPRAAIDSLGG
jgi:predicted nucleic acid-binding protein